MSDEIELGPGAPTPPIAIAGGADAATARWASSAVAVPAAAVDALGATGASISVADAELAEASRDWWPLAMIWATEGQVAAKAAVVAKPADTAQVSAIMAIAHEHAVPVTVAAGRSGVCGGSVPLHGGILLDLSEFGGIVDVDTESMIVRARSGTFGDLFEAELQSTHDLTVGHWPQSMSLSTVGGWAACRGAGQYSTRYGKIEDIVVGLEVVLADGRVVRTGGAPRSANGPDLTQLFVGSEGTLGVITEVSMRAPPGPTTTGNLRMGSTRSRRGSMPAAG